MQVSEIHVARRAAVGSVAGLLLFASLPPRGWWWAGVVSYALLATALRNQPPGARAAVGGAAGLGWFAPGLAWVLGFSIPGAILLVALQMTFVVLGALLVTRGRPLLLVPAVVLVEWVRTAWPLGGLPLAGPALGQVDSPLLAVAGLAGEVGLLAVTVLLGVAASELLRARWRSGAGMFAVVVAVALLGLLATRTTRVVGSPVDVAVAQGGGARGLHAETGGGREALGPHLAISRDLPMSTDLLVLPENVVDVEDPIEQTTQGARLAKLATDEGVTLIAGVTEGVGDDRFRNAAIAWAPTGQIVGRYEKVHRVPFGEYIPARDILSRIVDVSLVPRDAIPGAGAGLLETPGGQVGVIISYEVFFGRRARAAIAAGGEFLVVPTNASSFVTDDVPAQELAAARLRAVESGRAVIQAAPTGYSAIIAANGEVLVRSDLGAPQLLTGEVARRDGATPHVRLGDLPLLALAVAALLGAARRDRPDGIASSA